MNAKAIIAILVLCASTVQAQQQSILNSPHNLSVSGPGAIRATSEQEVCVFCHTPHNSAPIQPLWNRNNSTAAYIPYSSSSLRAKPGQPTGNSKLCLSCHDGTIAVGSVISRNQPIAMAGGITTLPPGHSNVGTDLSDDHPISFKYDAQLAAESTKLKSPAGLPPAVKLDRNQELQCTSCHDAHNNSFGKFMVMENTNSQLCNACHTPRNTTIAAHAECAACHQMHTAPSGAMLLTGVNASESCLKCHSSQPATLQGANIAADLNKLSRHEAPLPAPGPTATVSNPVMDVSCRSCHEPHTMETGTASAPLVSPKLGKINGVSETGGEIPTASYEYEVCFKCHGDNSASQPRITRQIAQVNTRLEFATSAVSYHPVAAPGRNRDMPSLRTTLTSGSVIACTDCHSSDTGKAASGTGPNGPHGSGAAPLLVARYDTLDNTPENAASYALCYRCHDRTSLLANESFSEHSRHIQQLNTPCSVCHDAHGISSAQGNSTNNAHLINFDTTVVLPDPVTNRIEYRTQGMRAGSCSLSCHGTVHSNQVYPAAIAPVPASLRPPVTPQRVAPRTPAAPRTR